LAIIRVKKVGSRRARGVQKVFLSVRLLMIGSGGGNDGTHWPDDDKEQPSQKAILLTAFCTLNQSKQRIPFSSSLDLVSRHVEGTFFIGMEESPTTTSTSHNFVLLGFSTRFQKALF
jgi:hypothetical protein